MFAVIFCTIFSIVRTGMCGIFNTPTGGDHSPKILLRALSQSRGEFPLKPGAFVHTYYGEVQVLFIIQE